MLDKLRVPQLSKTNYREWRKRMMIILKHEKCDAAIRAAGINDIDATEDEKSEAILLLSQGIPDQHFGFVEEARDDPCLLWQLLEEKYQPQNDERSAQLAVEWATFAMKSDDTIHTYYERYLRLLRQMKEAACSGTDQLDKFMYIKGLSDDYSMSKVIASKELRAKTLRAVHIDMVTQAQRNATAKETYGEALTAITKPTTQPEKQSGRKCFVCGSPDHYKWKCPKHTKNKKRRNDIDDGTDGEQTDTDGEPTYSF